MDLECAMYCSRVARDMDEDDLATLHATAVRNNSKTGMSGVLLLEDGMFLQVLEGPPAALDILLGHIRADPRHKDMRILLRKAVTERRFGGWAMALIDVGDIPGAVDDLLAQARSQHPDEAALIVLACHALDTLTHILKPS